MFDLATINRMNEEATAKARLLELRDKLWHWGAEDFDEWKELNELEKTKVAS